MWDGVVKKAKGKMFSPVSPLAQVKALPIIDPLVPKGVMFPLVALPRKIVSLINPDGY